jgi:LEA14-like dessication related protein
MENIKITDPHSNKEIEVEISPEENNHQQAWRIKLQNGENVLIGLDQHRIWLQIEGKQMDSGLVTNIGQAIENRQQSSSS